MSAAIVPFLAIIHFVALLCLSLYGVHRLWLIRCLILPKPHETLPVPFTVLARCRSNEIPSCPVCGDNPTITEARDELDALTVCDLKG
jgi:hypothetical protein